VSAFACECMDVETEHFLRTQRRPARDGYDDDAKQIIHKAACVTQFIDSVNPIRLLGSVHALTFDGKTRVCMAWIDVSCTTASTPLAVLPDDVGIASTNDIVANVPKLDVSDCLCCRC
jgi:hypothetical protein